MKHILLAVAGLLSISAGAQAQSVAESIGLPDNRGGGGARIMEGGTNAAHIMMPGR